ncbi:MAG: bifunctional adenosylcobinamide kinase/adenosylcobinamide-phosphate guanylyltransferase [Bacillota bacterium]|jgi:adenosylcobinamide kinase/adenosylcobinamide-phosphate guanylyltransferase
MAEITLYIGGARSGKSALAEEAAAACGKRVVYVATAGVWDEEMARRVELHRSRRPPDWETIEETHNVAGLLSSRLIGAAAVLVDCLTLWVTNLLLDRDLPWPGAGDRDKESYLLGQAGALADAAATFPAPVFLVTNEVGAGIVPANGQARLFRDVAGVVNRLVAARADRVIWTVAGIPVEIKNRRQKPAQGGE